MLFENEINVLNLDCFKKIYTLFLFFRRMRQMCEESKGEFNQFSET
jgi:hypothetical protein